MQRYQQIRALLILAVFSSFALIARADIWTTPVVVLTQKIVSKAGPGTAVTLTVRNSSSLTAADVNSIRGQIDSELRVKGLRVVSAEQAAVGVRVTLSENAQGYLWIAEIKQDEATDVVFVSVARMNPAAGPSSAMTLQRRLLWTQDEPILDLAIINPQMPEGAIILSQTRVAYYRIQNSIWQESDSAVITPTRPLPRDVRGMIVGAGGSPFEVALQGVRCTIAGNNPYRSSCVDSDDPWPIYEGQPKVDGFFSPARNFYTGAISRNGESLAVPPFYSAAMFNNSEWLFATTDGRIQYSSFVNTLPVSVTNWGSEIAPIRGKCSPETVVLATRNGDYTQTDVVQGFQMIARDPVPVTAAMELPGPVISLRSSGESVMLISRNLQTGKYEAYLLTLACNQ